MTKPQATPAAQRQPETIIRPQAKQEQFLSCPADIAVYGGAAGGGKTWCLLLEPMRHKDNGLFGAVIFRRTYKQVTMEGGMWDEAAMWYPQLGGQANKGELSYSFPSGAKVTFAHLQYEQDKINYQGAQIALTEWDELTHFSETQFFYLLSRARSPSGVLPYVRASTNPDASSWVKRLLGPWVDKEYPQKYKVLAQGTHIETPATPGEVRHFIRENGVLVWVPPDTPDAKSIAFFPAFVHDNPAMLRRNPTYVASLKALDYVEMRRLLYGDWDVMPEGGLLFNMGWFEILPALPAAPWNRGVLECRFWDFAATAKELKKDDPDYTATVKMRMYPNGLCVITDCQAWQEGPAEVDRLFETITRQDALQAAQAGIQYMARWEIEPGSAGKRESYRLGTMLRGLDAEGKLASGDKLGRSRPLAAQSHIGNVKLLQAGWNEGWLVHMHNQPKWPHDDIHDASAGAFNELTRVASLKAESRQG